MMKDLWNYPSHGQMVLEIFLMKDSEMKITKGTIWEIMRETIKMDRKVIVDPNCQEESVILV